MKTLLFALFLPALALHAQDPVPLPADHRWTFDNGREFPGAVGSLAVDPEITHDGQPALKLIGDFTKGGNYVVAGRSIDKVPVRELSFWLRTPDTDRLTLRINDGSGQTHQIDVKLEATKDWQHVVFPIERFFAHRGQSDAVPSVTRYESWGGAKDGQWHEPATSLYLLVTKHGESPLHTLWISGVELAPPVVAPPPFHADFSEPAWKLSAEVSREGNWLRLARDRNAPDSAPTATGPEFKAVPGQWEFVANCQSELQSPDNSYHGEVVVEAVDQAGKTLEQITVVELYGTHAAAPAKKVAELPAGTTAARFLVRLSKASGEFRVSQLSASFLGSSARRDERLARVLFSSAQLGNLLFPEDSRLIKIVAQARQPLSDATLECVVRDYWGAEQGPPMPVSLASIDGGKNYTGSLDLKEVPLEIGRYYEVHATLPAEGGVEPFHAFTSLAILPEAATKKYAPEEVPFTARNWDNRIPEYIRLTDRLGVRICGLWGGWSAKPPYEPQVPGLELCRQLGMGWLTNTPAATIEQGKTEYSETALREGVRNLIAKFGRERPMYINLGNEPHGTGDRVRRNVAAYQAIYEEVKKADPSIPVVATSVEPNEEYFKLGYGQWCDAFDFHIYEEFSNVRRTMEEYHALMEKYHCVKPIWSTELGLNSQGQTRLAVAVELIKKFTTFFASGGEKVSWFGLLYPDGEGKSAGTSGDSHNVFDCRFNHYAPRLDAIAYYDAVNAIGIKKFAGEKTYAGDVHAYLFHDRDGHQLQVLWKDHGRADVAVPMAGGSAVDLLRIDGSHHRLEPSGAGVTLSVASEPVLLLYDGPAAELPGALSAPEAALLDGPKSVGRRSAVHLALQKPVEGATLLAPPEWVVKQTGAEWTATPPAKSKIREADFTVRLPHGELNVRVAIDGE